MDICKGVTPMKQCMQMDDVGAIFFIVKTDKGIAKVMRADPRIEMGSSDFVKCIYSFRCQDIHFF